MYASSYLADLIFVGQSNLSFDIGGVNRQPNEFDAVFNTFEVKRW